MNTKSRLIKVKLNKRVLFPLLGVYVVCLMIWDFAIEYKLALILLVGVTFLFEKVNLFARPHFYEITYAIFILYFLLHTFCDFSIAPDISYEYIPTLLMNLIAIICCIKILNTRDRIISLMKIIIFITAILCIYIMIVDRSRIFSGNLGTLVHKPFSSQKYEHNSIPIFCAYSLMFLGYFRLDKIKFKYNYLFTCYFLLFIILSGARKALILASIGLIIYPYVFSGKRENSAKKVFKIVIAILIFCIAYYLIMNNEFLYQMIGQRIDGVVSGLDGGDYTESSARTRSIMINTGIELIKNNWWAGYGLGTFKTFPGSFGTWAHNTYIELTVSGGIWATIIYYLFNIYATIVLYKKYRYDKLGAMFLCITLYMFINDMVAVSYLQRSVNLVYCMINGYIVINDVSRKRNPKRLVN